LLGKPLICHTIDTALTSELFKTIVISSDCDSILEVASAYNSVQVIKRPNELATDHASKIPAIRHAVFQTERQTKHKFDYIFDLDATSPLRNVNDIKSTWELVRDTAVGNVFSVNESRKSPYFNMVKLDEAGAPKLICSDGAGIVRRQDSPQCYDMNASIYAWSREAFLANDGLFNKDTKVYLMPDERSIDIDNEFDWRLVELLMSN
jgi:CMP-N,N'-diacetyllegionaminic acid synthase